MHLFPYKWNLSNGYPAKGINQHNKTVFTTFSCGGGSSMGYKLAGYNVIAANDIDPQMQRVYIVNHHPKYYYLAPIKDLINKTDWPDEFKNLDVLDGSPPCSTFSMTGLRDKAWGKEKHFREGQAKQVLDDLFFDFVALAKKLQPKVIIAENVKGMMQGNAKGYLVELFKQFDEAGYNTQLFLLNAASMGVPQMRERIFFIGARKDLFMPQLIMNFNESPILFKDVEKNIIINEMMQPKLTSTYENYWKQGEMGKSIGKFNVHRKVHPEKVSYVITAHPAGLYHYKYPRLLAKEELEMIGSFPMDYNYLNIHHKYLIGMSVPPIMTAQVANQVYLQWLSKL